MLDSDPLWYKNAIIYELHLRSFYDSNGDGIGDIQGLIQKLPYVQALGVTCLWLLPMYPSPLKDDGYDISDYYNIHSDYGRLDDFRQLVEEAHRRGLRIITELVLNHTSDRHPWFQEARVDPNSPKRNWYVWSDTDQKYRGARIIFLNCENLPETHAYLKQLRRKIDAEYQGRVLLAEANQWPSDVRLYFGDGDEFHMGFHFPVMPRLYMAIRREERTPVVEIMEQTPEIPETCQWALFLRNHDELTLEMVTDEDRDYMYREYAKDSRMRLNLGIRRRLAPLLENGRRRIELMHSLLFSLPGTPVMYYGDEIGMGENVYLGDRNGVRTPMQWTGDRNAGFSRADAAALHLPVISDPVFGYQSVNVEAQERIRSSLLGWIQRVIRIRQRYPVFALGKIQFFNPSNKKVLAFQRLHQGRVVLVVCNLSRHAQPVEIDLSDFRGWRAIELFGETPFPEVTERPYQLSLGPYMFLWFRLEQPGAERASPSMTNIDVLK